MSESHNFRYELSSEVIDFIDGRLPELLGENEFVLQTQIKHGSQPDEKLQRLTDLFEQSYAECFNDEISQEKARDLINNEVFDLANMLSVYKPEVVYPKLLKPIQDMEASGIDIPKAFYGDLLHYFENYLGASGFESTERLPIKTIPRDVFSFPAFLSRMSIRECMQTDGESYYTDQFVDCFNGNTEKRDLEYSREMIRVMIKVKPILIIERLEAGKLSQATQKQMAEILLLDPNYQDTDQRDEIIATIDKNLFDDDRYYPRLAYAYVAAGRELSTKQIERLKDIAVQNFDDWEVAFAARDTFSCLPIENLLEILDTLPKLANDAKNIVAKRLASSGNFHEALNFIFERFDSNSSLYSSLVDAYKVSGDRRFIGYIMLGETFEAHKPETTISLSHYGMNRALFRAAMRHGHRDIMNIQIEDIEYELQNSTHSGQRTAIMADMFDVYFKNGNVAEAEMWMEGLLKERPSPSTNSAALSLMEFYVKNDRYQDAETLFFRTFNRPGVWLHALDGVEILAYGESDRLVNI